MEVTFERTHSQQRKPGDISLGGVQKISGPRWHNPRDHCARKTTWMRPPDTVRHRGPGECGILSLTTALGESCLRSEVIVLWRHEGLLELKKSQVWDLPNLSYCASTCCPDTPAKPHCCWRNCFVQFKIRVQFLTVSPAPSCNNAHKLCNTNQASSHVCADEL